MLLMSVLKKQNSVNRLFFKHLFIYFTKKTQKSIIHERSFVPQRVVDRLFFSWLLIWLLLIPCTNTHYNIFHVFLISVLKLPLHQSTQKRVFKILCVMWHPSFTLMFAADCLNHISWFIRFWSPLLFFVIVYVHGKMFWNRDNVPTFIDYIVILFLAGRNIWHGMESIFTWSASSPIGEWTC